MQHTYVRREVHGQEVHGREVHGRELRCETNNGKTMSRLMGKNSSANLRPFGGPPGG